MVLTPTGQFAIHLSTHVHNSALARDYLPEDFDPDPKGKFTPNVFNTVVFLTSCTQQVLGTIYTDGQYEVHSHAAEASE